MTRLKSLIRTYSKELLLTFLSAALIVLSFPNFELTGFIFIAWLPFFFATRHKTPKEAFFLGALLGIFIAWGAFYWVAYTLHEFGQLPWVLAILLFFGFSLFCNIHLAIFAYVFQKIPFMRTSLFWAPILFTSIEAVFPQIFHWYLGACLYQKLWLVQFADLTGVAGVTFFVILLNRCVFEIIIWVRKEIEIFPTYAFLVALILFFLAGAYSIRKLQYYEALIQRSPAIKAALIQTNIGNMEKLQSTLGYYRSIDHLHAVNQRLVEQASQTPGLDLIVLPETSVPGFFTKTHPLNEQRMLQLAQRVNVPIYFGGYDLDEAGSVYNSAFLISPYFQWLGTYRKIKLLVFGEYLPFAQTFPKLKEMFQTIGDFARGTTQPVMTLSKERRFAPMICFEGIFPDFVRRFVKRGANFIVIITNDSWFGPTANPSQHLMLQVWRAIENRTPVLRTANTGITAFVDITGKIRSRTSLFQETILVDQVALIDQKTFFTLYGNVFIWILFGLLGVGGVNYFFYQRRNRNQDLLK
ncbi:MAG: apolipoprotein N-acyltransferase [Deltaproteobacteria bacterium]|nr:apolipoprotein N-acyltransferase [Deltaproteobacteria bacterium]